jgi:hypothetical protein
MVHDFRWWFLPYCLKAVEKGRYVILNRAYKPIGTLTAEWVEYEPHAVKMRITPIMAQALSFNKDCSVETIYLYDDASVPTKSAHDMEKYLERLARLSAYKISV